MSTAAPTPFPSTTVAVDTQSAASYSAPDTVQDVAATPPPAAKRPFCLSDIATELCAYLSSPICAAAIFAALTWGVVHFLGARFPTRLLKVYAAGAFAAILYGTAALRDKNPLVVTRGLELLSTAQLPLLKRLLAAWFLTFPTIALAASVPRALTPTTMVLAADACMMAISYADQQGLLAKYV